MKKSITINIYHHTQITQLLTLTVGVTVSIYVNVHGISISLVPVVLNISPLRFRKK